MSNPNLEDQVSVDGLLPVTVLRTPQEEEDDDDEEEEIDDDEQEEAEDDGEDDGYSE
jgi:hypothetical protein